jgi:hypothetical protein
MKNLIICLLILCAFSVGISAQVVKKEMSQAEIDKIIKSFTTKEAEFREALKTYVFNRKATIQTIGMGGQVTGEYRRDSFMTFKDSGERFERILYFPIPTMKELSITPEDIEDLGGINPFALEPSQISLYNFNYLGKEKVDDLDLYVFDVSPKVVPDWKKSTLRLFTGRIWVDDRDLLIAKSKGKAIPEGKQRFPIVETWRENVDGKYWFPSFSSSDDELVFDNGFAVKIKMRVKYTNYKQGNVDIKILDDEPETKPSPTPIPKKP